MRKIFALTTLINAFKYTKIETSESKWSKDIRAKMQYVEPTYAQFLWDKFRFPTWEEARNVHSHWKYQEPMTEIEYQKYLNLVPEDPIWSKKTADSINRSRSRTLFGDYLLRWVFYFKNVFTYGYIAYANDKFDNAHEYWDYCGKPDRRPKEVTEHDFMMDEDDAFYDRISDRFPEHFY